MRIGMNDMYGLMRGVMFVCVVGVLGCVGCAGPTKVNIPPMAGDIAFHDPNGSTAVRVSEVSLQRILRNYPPEGVYAVALPDRSSDRTYTRILEGLAGSPVRISESAGDLPTYEIAQIQIHGTTADVDVIRPVPGGNRQLVRVELALDLDGWYASRVRPWDIPVLEQLRIIRGDLSPVRVRSPQTLPSDDGRDDAAFSADDNVDG